MGGGDVGSSEQVGTVSNRWTSRTRGEGGEEGRMIRQRQGLSALELTSTMGHFTSHPARLARSKLMLWVGHWDTQPGARSSPCLKGANSSTSSHSSCELSPPHCSLWQHINSNWNNTES